MWYLQQQNQSSRAQFYHLSAFSSLIPFITFILTGFLLLDKSQGFWVIHSVPLFPPSPEDGYGYPSSGESFGQTAICITFKYDQFTKIGMKNVSLRRPLSHHTSLIAFFEVSPQKFLVLDLFFVMLGNQEGPGKSILGFSCVYPTISCVSLGNSLFHSVFISLWGSVRIIIVTTAYQE